MCGSYVITTHFSSNAGEKLQNAEEGRGKPQEYNVSGLVLADKSTGAFYPSPLLRASVIRAVNGQEREGDAVLLRRIPGGITGSVWPVLMPLLLIADCGQKAEEDGAVILAGQGER